MGGRGGGSRCGKGRKGKEFGAEGVCVGISLVCVFRSVCIILECEIHASGKRGQGGKTGRENRAGKPGRENQGGKTESGSHGKRNESECAPAELALTQTIP